MTSSQYKWVFQISSEYLNEKFIAETYYLIEPTILMLTLYLGISPLTLVTIFFKANFPHLYQLLLTQLRMV